MTGRRSGARALFVSLVVLCAPVIGMFVIPASASTGCESTCSFNFTPPSGVSNEGPWELGVQFQTDIPAYATQICFWQAPGETGATHTVTLWNSTGAPVAQGTAATGTGENCVAIPPSELPANTTFTASYSENSALDYDHGFFASSLSNGHLHAPANAGVFGTQGDMPTGVFMSNTYGLDVRLTTPVPAPTSFSVHGASTTGATATFTGDGNLHGVYTVTCRSLFGGAPVSASGSSSPIAITGLGNKTTNDPTISDAVSCTLAEQDTFTGETSVALTAPVALLGVDAPAECTTPALTAPKQPSSAPGNASATVSWAPTQYAPPHGCVAGYTVTPAVGGVAQAPVLIPGPGTTTVIKGLANGTAYTFTIAAENGYTVGPASVSTAAVTVGTPTAPAAVKATRAAKGSIEIAFEPANGNGARITAYTATCRATTGAARSKSGLSGPLTVTGLAGGTRYVCSVHATNSRGPGPSSSAGGIRA